MKTNNNSNNSNNSKGYSLDEILARDDYKRLTAQLKDKVQDIAHRIYNKMEEVEHDELALDVIKAIDKHYTNPVELTPDDDEEFVDACERLDLDPEANDVKRVLSYPPTISAPGMLICMPYDWEIA